jgi:hypothetical protein
MRKSIVAAGACLVWLFVFPARLPAAVDSIYRAGQMAGRLLYWVPWEDIQPDTLGWQRIEIDALGGVKSDCRSPRAALKVFGQNRMRILRMLKPSALSVALAFKRDYRVFMLTQWHTTPTQKVVVPKPGMVQRAAKHRIVSDFLWEPVDKVSVEDPAGVNEDYRVRLYCREAGYSQYEGRAEVTGDNAQILGTHGFSVEVEEADYHEDLNVRRKVVEVYLVVSAEKSAADAASDIEQEMDKLKLDLTYTVPNIESLE